MADAGLPGPQAPLAPQPPAQLQVHDQLVPAQPYQHLPQLNWLHFEPEYTGKP